MVTNKDGVTVLPELIKAENTVAQILTWWPALTKYFVDNRMFCAGCDMAGFDTLGDIARIYGRPVGQLLQDLNALVEKLASA